MLGKSLKAVIDSAEDVEKIVQNEGGKGSGRAKLFGYGGRKIIISDPGDEQKGEHIYRNLN